METTTSQLLAPRSISLLIPDACWFEAPAERTAYFFPVFSSISTAVQTTLRALLVEALLEDPDRLEDAEIAWPILVYAASRPFRCQPRSEFTCDVLNSQTMSTFFRTAARNLPAVLEQVEAALREGGREDLAARYTPARADRIMELAREQLGFRRRLNRMLVAEGNLFNELVQFSGSKACPPRRRAQKVAIFVKRWNSLLRTFPGLYKGAEAGPQLLAAATAALLEGLKPSRSVVCEIYRPTGLAA